MTQAGRWLLVWCGVAVVMTGFDLLWLGWLMRPFYAEALGPLLAAPAYAPAAALFYGFYVTAIVVYAVWPASAPREAAWRGFHLGLVAYGTYELTNWAVIAGWPARLVPVDVFWGLVLTSAVAAVGAWLRQRLTREPSGEL
ncbi:MAG: DUF2177 family protein [Candidatus Sericytochromatia bacterium]|nr:DUF2177 family protein [Candidatus Sericytochromatia bacterium]